MNLAEFRQAIADHPDHALLVEHSGGQIAEHFHVTEVGRVEKDFVDCGGVRRSEVRCVLQTLVAGDFDHRLSSTKLSGILSLADKLDLSGDVLVEVEHQERSVSTDFVESVAVESGANGETLVIRLTQKHTACLAEDACGLPSGGLPTLDVMDSGCCGDTGCC